MRISSTIRQFVPAPKASNKEATPSKESVGSSSLDTSDRVEPKLLSGLAISEAAVEIPEVLIELSGIQDNTKYLGHGLRMGVSGLALARAVQAYQSDDKYAKLETLASLGTAVSSGASVFDGSKAMLIGNAAEGIHGLSEIAIGIGEIRDGLPNGEAPDRLEVAAGVLGVTKGATTLLPIFLPQTETAVGLAQIGLITARSVIAHVQGQG